MRAQGGSEGSARPGPAIVTPRQATQDGQSLREKERTYRRTPERRTRRPTRSESAGCGSRTEPAAGRAGSETRSGPWGRAETGHVCGVQWRACDSGVDVSPLGPSPAPAPAPAPAPTPARAPSRNEISQARLANRESAAASTPAAAPTASRPRRHRPRQRLPRLRKRDRPLHQRAKPRPACCCAHTNASTGPDCSSDPDTDSCTSSHSPAPAPTPAATPRLRLRRLHRHQCLPPRAASSSCPGPIDACRDAYGADCTDSSVSCSCTPANSGTGTSSCTGTDACTCTCTPGCSSHAEPAVGCSDTGKHAHASSPPAPLRHPRSPLPAPDRRIRPRRQTRKRIDHDTRP